MCAAWGDGSTHCMAAGVHRSIAWVSDAIFKNAANKVQIIMEECAEKGSRRLARTVAGDPTQDLRSGSDRARLVEELLAEWSIHITEILGATTTFLGFTGQKRAPD